MRQITLEEPGRFVRSETAPPDSLRPEAALVRVRRVGICGTDLHAYRGQQPFFSYPRILGHELGVEVLEVGPNDRSIRPGDLCAVEPYMNCGDCGACRQGRSNCCERLRVLGVHTDGGMREFMEVSLAKLHRSQALSVDQLALVETLGIGAHAVDRAAVRPDDDVLVIGAGPIGLSVVQFAKLSGARVTLFETRADRAEFCRSRFEVEHTAEPGGDALESVRDVLDGRLPAVVFDATGSRRSMIESFRCVANGGRLVFVGLVTGEVKFDDAEFHRREITLFATRNSLPSDFVRIVRLMESGEIDTDPWITHRAVYETLPEEFPGWLDADAGVVKAVLEL